MGSPLGRNKEEFPLISEVGLGDHISRINGVDTCRASLVRDLQIPNRQGTEVLVGVNQRILRREDIMDTYLVYHVNEDLGIITREISDHLDLLMVREDGRYQRDALVRGKGRADQPFPAWRVTITTHNHTVKLSGG